MGDPMLRLMELEARHTELLERLSELDGQIDSVLNDWTRSKEQSLEPTVETVCAED